MSMKAALLGTTSLCSKPEQIVVGYPLLGHEPFSFLNSFTDPVVTFGYSRRG